MIGYQAWTDSNWDSPEFPIWNGILANPDMVKRFLLVA